MAEMMFWGFLVRFLVSLIQASPFILVGFAAAAVLRRFFGYEETRKLFGEGTRSALFRAWVIGMLLPVCSLGAIPVIREMRRAGIRGGTILAFAMSGPLFNPLSLLYGLTLSEPIAILSFAACSLVIVTIVGCFAYYSSPDECLEAMTDTRIGAMSAALSMDHTETKYWSERYDDWTRRLEVGGYLRHGELSDYHRWKARLLREQLETLEHEVEDGERDEVTKLISRISRLHNRMSHAFREEF